MKRKYTTLTLLVQEESAHKYRKLVHLNFFIRSSLNCPTDEMHVAMGQPRAILFKPKLFKQLQFARNCYFPI